MYTFSMIELWPDFSVGVLEKLNITSGIYTFYKLFFFSSIRLNILKFDEPFNFNNLTTSFDKYNPFISQTLYRPSSIHHESWWSCVILLL